MSVGSPPLTIAELIEQVGVPPDRIRCQPPPGLASEADVVRLNEQRIYCELIDGVLVEKAVGQYESRLALWLAHFLLEYLERHPGLGIVHGPDSPHRMIGGQIRYPDVAFVRTDRLPGGKATKDPIAPWAPSLAVEVVSAGNTPQEMELKRDVYFESGVELVWYLYPRQGEVHVYTSAAESRVLGRPDELDGGDVLPGFRLSIERWLEKAE